MRTKEEYNGTVYACFTGYIVQAIVNNFVPLLFLTFRSEYGLTLDQIALFVTVNFGVQLCVDLLASRLVDRIGYRFFLVAAHICAALGLVGLAALPPLFRSSYAGLLTAVVVYAVGGGLIEVLVSPVVEACPTKHKAAAMSLLHSFYCWGHVGVVLLSTLYFALAGVENWRMLACIWAVVPAVNALVFLKVPIPSIYEEGEKGMGLRALARSGLFWLMLFLMACAGSCEQAVSQWASAFAETGLGVGKTAGDLAGPLSFAAMMGLSRLFYGKYSGKIRLEKFMLLSALLCLASYLLTSLSPVPLLGFMGCALCGLSVGILWPGTFSIAAGSIRNGGTAMFAMFALAGDLGCLSGPAFVGVVSEAAGGSLRTGILAAVIFPVFLLAGLLLFLRSRRPEKC